MVAASSGWIRRAAAASSCRRSEIGAQAAGLRSSFGSRRSVNGRHVGAGMLLQQSPTRIGASRRALLLDLCVRERVGQEVRTRLRVVPFFALGFGAHHLQQFVQSLPLT
jgi:hypothetical protein